MPGGRKPKKVRYALGMTFLTSCARLRGIIRIEFPLAIRQALPAYGNELVLMVKGTSLASTITVLEITGYAKRLMSQTFAIFEVFAIAGVLYLALNLVLIGAIRLVERRLMRHTGPALHARPVTSPQAS